MKLRFATVGSLILLGGMAFGQTDSGATFLEADVHVSKPDSEGFGGLIPGNRFEMHAATMLGLLRFAYGLPDDRIIGGPAWLDTSRFDIIAKVPAGTNEEAAQIMLRNLLADRFKLVAHNEQKPLPVFVLIPGKGSNKLKPGTGDADCKLTVPNNVRTFTCHNMTMASLVQRLPPVAAAYITHPFIDMTGLTGAFDFTIEWVGRGLVGRGGGGDGDAPPTLNLFDAVDQQLGLKIEPRNQPLLVIVVEKVNEKPTDNAPGVSKAVSDLPTEFEVGEIKISAPGTQERGDVNPGHVNLFSIPMKDLITMVWNVEDGAVVGPKWIETERYDLVAKTPGPVPFENMRLMVIDLLAKKLGLQVHMDKQPQPVYALTAGKTTKLKPADPSNRAACKIVPGDGIRNYVCQNTTMAQFTEKLRDQAQGYIDHPVVDLTGLTGAYDFTVSWAPIARIRAAQSKKSDPGAASTPSGDLTLFEAIDKQLGLKLAPQKYPQPVVVIDHINRTPAEN